MSINTIIRPSRNQSILRSTTALPLERVVQFAPAIASTGHAEHLSSRYAQISTLDVLNGLGAEGFYPIEVRSTRARTPEGKETCKHMLRLRHQSQVAAKVNETFPEVVLVNSHDGTSSYQLMAGLFRLVCSNGMIAGNASTDIRIKHSGDVVNNVIEGSYRVLDDIKQLPSRVEAFQNVHLTGSEQLAFANAAIKLRYEDGEAPIVPGSLLQPQRWEDRGNDLWKTLNVVQERMLRGGVRGRSSTGRRMSTREVTSVSENVRLNRALWTLADEMAKLKS